MKKIVLILIVVLCATLFGLTAAQGEQVSGPWTYELTSEGLVIKGYSSAEANVVIPDEIDGYAVTIIGREAFIDNHDMRSVTIPESVSSIRANAFFGCTALAEINFNAKNCVVPQVWIYSDEGGCGVFSGAGSASPQGLKVVFGDKVKKVPDDLFDTASIDEYGHNGYAYAYVTEVVLSDSIKEIGQRAFRGCQSLESVTFGSKVKSIGDNAFQGCVSLDNLAFNDALLTIGPAAFSDDASLENIEWGAGLETIGVAAFRNCPSIRELPLVSPLTTVDRSAFENCTGLEALTLPESVTRVNANAFLGCIKLGQVNINCVNLTVPDIWIYSDDAGCGVFSGAGSAAAGGMVVTFGEKAPRIPDHLFDTASIDEYGKNGYSYAYVTEVVLSDAVKEIGQYAFRNCQSLESVTFGTGLQTIGVNAFRGCIALDDLAFDDALLTIGSEAFFGNTSLESIEWGAGLETIGVAAFRNCPSIQGLNLPAPLTTLDARAFAGCEGLESVTLPESMTYIGGEAFQDCIKLKAIDINCVNLSAPDVWIYSDDNGCGVFSGAGSASTSGLKVTFGEKASKVPSALFDTASIDEYGHGGYAYAYITEVELPASVVEVGNCAFRSCHNLTAVRFAGADAAFGEGVFDNCVSQDFHIECPKGGSVEQYALENGFACETTGAVDPQPDTTAEAEQPANDGSWTCENGHEGNTGNFCTECGAARPAPACPECGYTFEDGQVRNFCPNCGAKQE